jgi:DNA-binding LytR/AlgR family response regulator
MKLQCLIIDDEPIARKILKEFIQEIEFLEIVGSVENPVKAIPILNKIRIDVVFLDINMPRMNGYEFLKSFAISSSIIITTAYPEYAVEGFALNVLDYLVKPIAFERFEQACLKAKRSISAPMILAEKKPIDHFFIKYNSSIEKIFYRDLFYVEGLLNYVVLHTTKGNLMVYMTVKSMLEQLPSEQFIKVHKSFVINIDKVESIEGNVIHINGDKISISQNLKSHVMERILKDSFIRR